MDAMTANAAPEVEERDRVPEAIPLPRGFFMRSDGLYLQPDDPEKPPVHVCGRLAVATETRDADGRAWGVLLRWLDREGREHQWAMPRSMLAGDGAELRAHLLDGGLFLAPGRKAREALMSFLAAVSPGRFARVVSRLGWHATAGGRVFVLPHRTLGASASEDVMLQTDRPDALPPLRQAGTLAEWQREIAARAVGNSRLAFAISAAFAAPPARAGRRRWRWLPHARAVEHRQIHRASRRRQRVGRRRASRLGAELADD
jgi:hypothetical protein